MYVVFQRSAVLDCMACNMKNRWVYYMLHWASILDVSTWMVETRAKNSNVSIVTKRELSLRQIPTVHDTERRITFNVANDLGNDEKDEREKDMNFLITSGKIMY